jgi:peroxiredoxin
MLVFSHVTTELTTVNLFKSVFISGFVTWLALVSLYALTQLIRGMEPIISWLGLALSAFAPLTFFIKVFLFRSPRTERHPIEYSILSGIGLVLTMAMSYRYADAAGAIHIWAGITLLLWLAYLRWYSVFRNRDNTTLKVGAPLPEFRLESLDGHIVSSQSFMASAHLILFYRGNWCPFCTAQIEELAAAYKRLEANGIKVVLISPQSSKKNQALAARFDLPMTFLRDRNCVAAKQLGIYHEWGTPMGMQLLGYASDTVLPTVLLTDQHGQIVYCDQTDNYRVRPEPDTWLKIDLQD